MSAPATPVSAPTDGDAHGRRAGRHDDPAVPRPAPLAGLDAALGRRKNLDAPWVILGAVVLVTVWALASQRQPELILPSPAQTWDAFWVLLTEAGLLGEVAHTLGQALIGVALAFTVGLVWGGIAGRFRWFSSFTQPLLSVLMALPPVILVALGIVWFGPGGAVTRLVVALVALPLIVIAVTEAVQDIDSDLLEMARSFELSRTKVLRHVVAPAIASPVLAATSVTVGQALRVAVMAELLSATVGVGGQVRLAQTNLDTAALFAWAITLVVVVMLIETLLVRPVSSRLLRWRTASTA